MTVHEAQSPYLPTAFGGAAWTLAPDVRALPVSSQRSVAALNAEAELRDFVMRYAYTLDRGNVDEVMRFFTADCVMMSRDGTFTGEAELRAEYERMIRDAPRRMHHFSNVIVRLSDDLATGYVSCYVTSNLEAVDGSARQASGLIVVEVVRAEDDWRIRQRWVSIDVVTPLAAG